MQRAIVHFAVLVVSISSAIPALSDDQPKAEKQLRRITAMASDVTARGIVSKTVSDLLNVKRSQLVEQRQATGLNYGSLFLAHELISAGASFSDIAAQLKNGENILQIANDRQVAWKEVCSHAKKLNGKIEDNIYKHFLDDRSDKTRDKVDQYDSLADWVASDGENTQQDILEAQEIYTRWRDHASPRQSDSLGSNQGQVVRNVRGDPIRDGAPKGNTTAGPK